MLNPDALIKDKIKFDDFINRVKSYAHNIGIPGEVFDQAVPELLPYIRELYESTSIRRLTAAISDIVNYIVEEYIPAKSIVLTYHSAISYGINIRPPREVIMHGVYTRPSIDYIWSLFRPWADELRSINYTVYEEPVVVYRNATNIIHDPGVDSSKIQIRVMNDRIIAVNHAAVAYTVISELREAYYYKYIPAPLLFM